MYGRLDCALLQRGRVETVSCKDVIVCASEVCGMSAVEEEVTIPTNNDILEAGQDGGVGILTEVVLKDVDSVFSGVEWFTNVDGSIVKADEL